MPIELQEQFKGRGETKGFTFTQIRKSSVAYVYEVKSPDRKEPHYEVFKRVVNTQFDRVAYPKSKSFGMWAFCMTSLPKALSRFRTITQHYTNDVN